MIMLNDTKNKSRAYSPWVLPGVAVVLGCVLYYTAMISIGNQERNRTLFLLEKGDALIKTFEAGARAVMTGRGWDMKYLEKLLSETASQPDVQYIIVLDGQGRVVMESESDIHLKVHREGVESGLPAAGGRIRWRWMEQDGFDGTLEVYRPFFPARGQGWRWFWGDMHHGKDARPDWKEPRREMGMGGHGHRGMMGEMAGMRGRGMKGGMHGKMMGTPHPPPPGIDDMLIYVGLTSGIAGDVITASIRQTKVISLSLFLACVVGLVLLHLFVNYRSTRASLSKIRAFSDSLVEHMPIGLLFVDQYGKIAACNSGCESISGKKFKDLKGVSVDQSVFGPVWDEISGMGAIDGVLEKETLFTAASGTRIPVELSATRLMDGDGNPMGHVFLFKDLSEITSLRKEIAKKQRLASIGLLAGGVAHEIRNPLSSLKGFAVYFRDKYTESEGEIAGIMIEEVERMNRVIGELLEFSKPVVLTRKPENLEQLIRSSLRAAMIQSGDVSVRTEFPENFPDIPMDRDRMSQVFLNLYLNAVEAMDGKGVLGVSLEQREREAFVCISDSGRGIPREDLAHIFDPYFTTKSTGTGLGLAIVHNILDAHGGRIHAESLVGEGSSFTLVLPMEEENP